VRRALACTLTAVLLLGPVPACSSADDSESPARGSGAPSLPAVPTVWPTPDDPSAAAARAGLEMLDREMLEVHYHAHLDVAVRGVAIQVPANIGIDVRRQRISALHTHDVSGIVHIESGVDIPFTLGQFFTEWGQPLTADRVGPVAVQPGEELRVSRNGKRQGGDVARLRFRAHDEIVVWLGPATEQPRVPTSYRFPEGL
jgi:hypothetical protein